MLWKLAAPLRVVLGIIRDELAAQRLQDRESRLRRAVPGYSNDEIDRAFKHAEYMRRRRGRAA